MGLLLLEDAVGYLCVTASLLKENCVCFSYQCCNRMPADILKCMARKKLRAVECAQNAESGDL